MCSSVRNTGGRIWLCWRECSGYSPVMLPGLEEVAMGRDWIRFVCFPWSKGAEVSYLLMEVDAYMG